MSKTTGGTKAIRRLLDAAKTHGLHEDPEHEVGDLQDLLLAAWGLMSPEQRASLLASDEARAVLENG